MPNHEGGPDDLELIHRVLGGEEKAFEVLMEKYYPRIDRLASVILSDPAAAEDITQEVFLRAYQALPRFRGDASVYSWLYRITVNLCLNFLSRRRTQPLPEQAAPQPQSSDALTQLEARQWEAFVRKALDTLPPHYRVPVILSAVEGLTYREISTLLGIPMGTVKSRINFGKRLLKERLRPLLHSENTRKP